MSCRYFIWISRLVLWQRSSILKCTQIICGSKLYIFSAFKHKPFRCISCFCVVIHFWSFSQRMSVYLSIIFFKKSVVVQLSMENFSITCTIEQGIVTLSLLWDADVIHVCPGIILYTVHARYTWVKARTVPLTFKLTKVKMHKTRWGNGLRVRH